VHLRVARLPGNTIIEEGEIPFIGPAVHHSPLHPRKPHPTLSRSGGLVHQQPTGVRTLAPNQIGTQPARDQVLGQKRLVVPVDLFDRIPQHFTGAVGSTDSSVSNDPRQQRGTQPRIECRHSG
jgi:hypothetical protein